MKFPKATMNTTNQTEHQAESDRLRTIIENDTLRIVELEIALKAMVAAANRADVKMRDAEIYAALPAARAAIKAV